MKSLIILLSTLCFSCGFAHRPFFLEGSGPFDVTNPEVSKAYYLRMAEGETHSFVVEPLARAVPIQVLVLDNEQGRSLDFEATWTCEGETEVLREVDVYFHEPFSNLEHRYRVMDSRGPSSTPCILSVRERQGYTGPYTVSVGDEERFTVADIFGFFDWGSRLAQWQSP